MKIMLYRLFQLQQEWVMSLLTRAYNDKVLSWTKGIMALNRSSQKFYESSALSRKTYYTV